MKKKGCLGGGFLLFGKGKCEEWEWGCTILSLGGWFLNGWEWPGPTISLRQWARVRKALCLQKWGFM